jgi:hypothetical protein
MMSFPVPSERPWMYGPAGGIRYLCPFDCGWCYEEPVSFRIHINEGETIADAINADVRRRKAETEAALREHLTEHTAAVILSEG